MQKHNVVKKILISIVSLVFLMAAYSKLSGNPMAVQMLETLNIGGLRIGLGVIDIILALTLWWKETRTIGILIATSYFGAALMAELFLGAKGIAPGVLSLMLWVVFKIDSWHPSMCAQCGAPTTPRMCDCKKEGCVCEHGKCSC